MTTKQPQRGMRADARLNRRRIVEAARDLIAERGAEVPTEEVARRAGVGVGTVYRHFPDRSALIRGVALDSFERVVEIARAAEDEEADAWSGLSRFVRRAATELRLATWLSIWFAGTWAELREDPENQRLRRVLMRVLDRIVRRAQEEGDLRPDIDAADLVMVLAALLRPVPGLPVELARQSTDRHLVLMLDGLRAGARNSGLPEQGVTLSEFLEP
ncbi:TetR/AcrR family transcriptional regulator [Nocardiopsis ganjiahuensis]|uniref:TetR/AcrR family transcriptional regulator n=1 Tax=Nocardiopsis ganjiahuensis TaxID=239984 RepID=UPI00047615B0|nr:TetR/AcrR family transcriptional regulator [Nocardiopsis ganjiahuensis]